MSPEKLERLRRMGGRVMTVEEWLELTPDEVVEIERRLIERKESATLPSCKS